MRKLFFITSLLIIPFCLNAREPNPLAVENQFPGNSDALKVYKSAAKEQADTTTAAIRTSWIANRPGDNWFFSLSAGAAHLLSEETRYLPAGSQLNPTYGFAFGKWMSPVWGLRLNVTGAKLNGFATWFDDRGYGEWYVGDQHPNIYNVKSTNTYVSAHTEEGAAFVKERFLNTDKLIHTGHGDGYGYDFMYMGVSLDFLLNLKNTFKAYNPKAFFNPVIYGGFGYAHTFKEDHRTAVNNIMEKIGGMANFRLSDNCQLFLDVQFLFLPEIFDRRAGAHLTQDMVDNYTIGFTYQFNFRHFIKSPVYEIKAVETLTDRVNELRSRSEAASPSDVISKEKSPVDPVFFELGSYELGYSQLISIRKAAMYLYNHPKSKIRIEGYADKNAGTPELNLKLAQNRANAVGNALFENFGIDRNRLIIKYFGDTVQPFEEGRQNRVAILVIP
ncbi:MAG: OmpA family protein [Candidatus Symbiothrix sp.]|nr:OmpA family protein [Candidatus Symbiothrix sp.]